MFKLHKIRHIYTYNIFCCYEDMKKVIDNVINCVQTAMQALEDDVFDIKVILSELLCNAIKHANNCDNKKKITVIFAFETMPACVVTFAIKDYGCGFDYKKILNKDPIYFFECCSDGSTNDNMLCETGRGIWIVKNLSDSIKYNKKGNTVVIRKTIKKVTTNNEY